MVFFILRLMIQYPNGLMTSFGPFDGTTHDSTAAQVVHLDELITRNYTFQGIIRGAFILVFFILNFRHHLLCLWRFWLCSYSFTYYPIQTRGRTDWWWSWMESVSVIKDVHRLVLTYMYFNVNLYVYNTYTYIFMHIHSISFRKM